MFAKCFVEWIKDRNLNLSSSTTGVNLGRTKFYNAEGLFKKKKKERKVLRYVSGEVPSPYVYFLGMK